MSNIYEALEQAQRDKSGIKPGEMIQLTDDAPVEKTRLRNKRVMKAAPAARETEMATLYRTIDLLLPEQTQKTIQFIGSQEGEGVSTVVREIAKIAATRLGRKVLVLDAAHHNPAQHVFFNVKNTPGRSELLKNGEIFDGVCYQTGNANLCIASFPNSSANSYFVDAKSSVAFLDNLKKRFDLILIDSSPLITAADSVALSRYVDGVILVLEAERTKWFNAESLREKVQNNGGNILGVVFNKRRYHIPKIVYHWLF
jgi:protein-tyrosine kinase